MLIDTRTLSDGTDVTADVCIVGGGPAGMVCAREFLESGLKVVLLESGGLHRDPRAQALSGGRLEGDVFEPMEESHLRQIGGTANHWIIKMADKRFGYRFTPLDAIDFEAREGFPHSGWPITRADLDPFYERAHHVCGVGPFDYRAQRWQTEQVRPLPLPPQDVETCTFMFAPTAIFTTEIPRLLQTSQNVHAYHHATVVELIPSPDGQRVDAATVRTFEGRTLRFAARRFVLAGNGLQTPRLMLASRRVHPNGIGNDRDVLGRYYMDHSLVPSGNVYPSDPRVINQLSLYDMRLVEGTSVLGALHVAPDAMRRERLTNFCATLFPMPPFGDVDALLSVKEIAKALMERRLPGQMTHHVARMWAGRQHLARVAYEKLRYDTPIMPGFGRGGWSRLKNNETKYPRMELLAFVEQTPDPDNRVTLIAERDELGMPKIKLRYRWPDADLDSIRRAQALMARALCGAGLGRYEPPSPPPGGRLPVVALHHMSGTARMHDDPRKGVVDRHCRVHGVGNLYVSGSAVFTTGGFANPTLTNLALTIRVADTVKRSLSSVEHVTDRSEVFHQETRRAA